MNSIDSKDRLMVAGCCYEPVDASECLPYHLRQIVIPERQSNYAEYVKLILNHRMRSFLISNYKTHIRRADYNLSVFANEIFVLSSTFPASLLKKEAIYPLSLRNLNDDAVVCLSYIGESYHNHSIRDISPKKCFKLPTFDEAFEEFIKSFERERKDDFYQSNSLSINQLNLYWGEESASMYFYPEPSSGTMDVRESGHFVENQNQDSSALATHENNTIENNKVSDSNEPGFSKESKVYGKWAPIVYSRTYSGDYRLLSFPEDLEHYKEEIKSFIAASCRYAEKIRNSQRWIIIRKHSYCLVGVICMADDVSSEQTQDRNDRRMHVFLGYITKDINSKIPSRNIDNYKKLYNIVKDRWQGQQSRELLSPKYLIIEFDYDVEVKTSSTRKNSVNFKECIVKAWNSSVDTERQLWTEVCDTTRQTSLCLGMARVKDIRNGPFMNATLLDNKIEIDPLVFELNEYEGSAPERKEDEFEGGKREKLRRFSAKEMMGAIIPFFDD